MYLAIDGGATKTIAILVNENTFDVERIGLSGPSNLRSVSVEVSTANIKSAMEKAIASVDKNSISESIYGIAGYGDSTLNSQRVEGIVEEVAGEIPYIISNDGEIASFLITTGMDGCIVAPGTGSVGSYITNGKSGRVGGWSFLTGDQGSAFWIARKALEMAEKSYDELLPKTDLIEEFQSYFRSDLRDIVANLEENFDKRRIASLSTIVDRLADAGDKLSGDVLHMAFEEIALMIDGMKKKLPSRHITGCAGGVIRSRIIREKLKSKYGAIPLYYGYHIVAGGIMKLLSQKSKSLPLEDIREKIVKGIDNALESYDTNEKEKFLFL